MSLPTWWVAVEKLPPHASFLTKFGTDTSAPRGPFGLNLRALRAFCLNSGFFVWRSGPPAAGVGLRKLVIWVPCFSRARRCFPIFLGRLLGRRARICLSLSFLGWPSIFLFSGGSAQLALGRPLNRFSAAGSRVLPCETRAAAEG